MKRTLVILALIAFATSCRPARECKGLITGPEFHRDTVTLRCK